MPPKRGSLAKRGARNGTPYQMVRFQTDTPARRTTQNDIPIQTARAQRQLPARNVKPPIRKLYSFFTHRIGRLGLGILVVLLACLIVSAIWGRDIFWRLGER